MDDNDPKIDNFIKELYNWKSIDFDEYPFTNQIFEDFEKDLISYFTL